MITSTVYSKAEIRCEMTRRKKNHSISIKQALRYFINKYIRFLMLIKS